MSTITELRAKQEKLVADARGFLAEIKDDTAEDRVAELETQHDRAMAEYDRLEERVKREEALAARESALNAADERRPTGENRDVRGNRDERTVEEREAAAFDTFLRGGIGALDAEQRSLLRKDKSEERAQAVGTGPAGGYLAPDAFVAELIKSLKAWGPMLDPGVTRQITTTTGTGLTWPTFDDTNNEGSLIGENTQVALAEVEFGTRTLDAFKYTSGVVLISDELLQDAAMDVEGIVRAAKAERIGRIVNKHLTIGDGASKPRGIVTAAGTAPAAGAAAITFDDMIDLQHAVDPAYRSDPSIRWMFNDSTLKALRKLKDGDLNYIWQPANVQTGAPASILGYGYEVNQAMANVGSGNRSVVFGAMNRYIVRRTKEFTVKRLVERYADYGQVGLIGFARFDGDLMDTAAVKALLHP